MLKNFTTTTFLFLLVSPAIAATSLSVTSSEGGNSVRFGQVDSSLGINKEVRIRINSNDNQQYQIFQRMLEPLINEKGSHLDHDVLSTYTVPGSSSSGTLYAQEKEILGSGDQLLYTSSQNGDSDLFSVVYFAEKERIKESGEYLGKIMYTLRPLGGNPQEDVFLDISLDASVESTVKIEGSSGKNEVRLSNRGIQDQEGSIKINFTGNNGPIRIYQEVESFPTNDLNDDINAEIVMFMTSESEKDGIKINDWQPISQKRELIYDSQVEADDFFVNFRLNQEELNGQQAGDFKGKIKFTIEQNTHLEIINIDLGVYITPIFKMDVQFPKEGVRFYNLLPGAPPQTKEVTVTVNTNLGKPYTVLQNVTTSLVNEQGEKIAKDFFLMKVELLNDQKGKSEFSDFNTIADSEVPIFFSDSKGSSAEFKVIYQLKPYPDMISGEYSAAFVYSLNQL